MAECQAVCFHLNLFWLWISRLPFADFTVTKSTQSSLKVQFVITCHILCFILFQETVDALSHCASKVHFQRLTAEKKERIHFITSYGMNPLTVLWAEWAPGVSDRGCLCCQSKPEQWLRLISILMNANWHICYGGLAVQTLQLAWLINYPPAGGSLEMEAGERVWWG